MTPAGEKLDRHLSDAIAELRTKPMSVIDKMQLVMQRRADLNKSLDARAQELLDRYADADKKADQAFSRHHSQLDNETTALDEVESAIAQMSNMGNSPGSGG
jgi:hypothetical protein